jgi:hypothetical protein
MYNPFGVRMRHDNVIGRLRIFPYKCENSPQKHDEFESRVDVSGQI